MDEEQFPGMRWQDLLCIAAVGALLVALSWLGPPTAALAADAPAAPASPAPVPLIQVLGFKCDGNGGVVALKLASPGPGTIDIAWDNRVVCGTRT